MGTHFGRACCDWIRGNGFKVKSCGFRLAIKKNFMMRMMKNWKRSPREVVDAPCLETFKVRLDRALRSLIYLKMSLFVAEGLD